jgi:adenosylcobyric acid synthase
MVKSLMFMGTGSDVGKSLLVAGLCRAYANRGLESRPVQAAEHVEQCGSDGGWRGDRPRADAAGPRGPARAADRHEPGPAQARARSPARRSSCAAGASPPCRPASTGPKRGELLPQVLDAYDELAADADLVLVEGAGSASEINLRHNDIANFGFARAANVPVVLIGDIERGGVIASIVGTFAVIDPAIPPSSRRR